MDCPSEEILSRLPLAEGVLWLWRWITRDERMETVWETHRGRCYKKSISFPVIVQLVADAVMQFDGSGRRSFEHAREENVLDATVQAAYGKLRRLPIPLSQGFLSQGAADLLEVFPSNKRRELPASLAAMTLMILDGKAVKRVAKRLTPFRGITGGLVGGKALVAQEWSTGLAVAMEAHADGDINEVRLVEPLVRQARAAVAAPRLWMADCAFCDLDQPTRFTAEAGDHFLVRYHPKVKFYVDANAAALSGKDEQGRSYMEEWGWLGSEKNKRRRYVRRIHLTLSDNPQEDLVLVTDLLDARQFPAVDLLKVYAERWGIEHMFQDVTEVFGLKRLIGGTPQACLFQLAFCLLLYNMIEVLRGFVAQGQQRPIDELSDEKLFEDVERQLIAWNVMIDLPTTLAHLEDMPTATQLHATLKRLLSATWEEHWLKSPAQLHHGIIPRKCGRTHHSTYRLLQAVSHARLKARKKTKALAAAVT
jgi:hypothetical protein